MAGLELGRWFEHLLEYNILNQKRLAKTDDSLPNRESSKIADSEPTSCTLSFNFAPTMLAQQTIFLHTRLL